MEKDKELIEKYRQAEKEFGEKTKPLYDVLINLRATAIPKITILPDSEIIFDYDKETKRLTNLTTKHIHDVRKLIFKGYGLY